MAYTLESVLKYLQAKEAQAYKANLERKEKIENIYDTIISRYGEGGTYGEGYKAELETAKRSAVGSAIQSDISRGLYGVTNRAQQWEKEVGAPSRLKLEDIRTERLSAAEAQKAQFLAGIEEPYPDYGTIASLAMQASSTPSAGFSISKPSTSSLGGLGTMSWGTSASTPATTYVRKISTPTSTVAPTYGATPAYTTPTKTSSEYQTYLSNLKKTQGTGVVTATPSEYKTIQERLKKLYGTNKTSSYSSGYRQYGAWSI